MSEQREQRVLRILLVTSMFAPYHRGGVSSHVRDLAEMLAKKGHEVTIFTSRRRRSRAPNEEAHTPKGAKIVWTRSFPAMLLRIGKLVREGRFDVVNFHSQNTLALAPMIFGSGAAIVFTFHSDTSNYLASVRGWTKRSHPFYVAARWFERLTIKFPAATIVVSKRMQRFAESLGLRDTILVPNAVDASYWSKPMRLKANGARWIIVPRMHVPKNGIEYAIEAMSKIVPRVPNAYLLLTGDGPLRLALEEQAEHLVPGRVHFLGIVSREMMRSLYANADLVTIPSITSAGTQENTSIAALEAMASGKPVVATQIGGLVEIVRNEEDGFLVPEKDAAALADAAVRLLSNPGLAAKLGRQARERVTREFSLEAWVDRVLAAYERALEEHGPRWQGPAR
jgi:glycosyltransferase involved in cell wall biosynthesis